MILPLIILVILLAIVVYGCVIAAKEIRANYKTLVEDKKIDEIHKEEDEIKVSIE